MKRVQTGIYNFHRRGGFETVTEDRNSGRVHRVCPRSRTNLPNLVSFFGRAASWKRTRDAQRVYKIQAGLGRSLATNAQTHTQASTSFPPDHHEEQEQTNPFPRRTSPLPLTRSTHNSPNCTSQARIKRIMQKDEEVGKVAQATPVVICTYRGLLCCFDNIVDHDTP